MKTAIVVAIVIIVLALGVLAVTVFNMTGNYETALINAKKLLHENITTTYNVTIYVQSQGYIKPPPIIGLITISHMPNLQALVINGTLSSVSSPLIPISFTVPVKLAVWEYNNELCYSMGSIHIGNIVNIGGVMIHCTPYVNITKNVIVVLNESKYIGEGSWNGQKTYCFQSQITTSTQGIFQLTYVINITRICLLSNGVPTNIEITAFSINNPYHQITMNATLINYNTMFNQEGFKELTGGLLPG